MNEAMYVVAYEMTGGEQVGVVALPVKECVLCVSSGYSVLKWQRGNIRHPDKPMFMNLKIPQELLSLLVTCPAMDVGLRLPQVLQAIHQKEGLILCQEPMVP